jgi:hypothetical protein
MEHGSFIQKQAAEAEAPRFFDIPSPCSHWGSSTQIARAAPFLYWSGRNHSAADPFLLCIADKKASNGSAVEAEVGEEAFGSAQVRKAREGEAEGPHFDALVHFDARLDFSGAAMGTGADVRLAREVLVVCHFSVPLALEIIFTSMVADCTQTMQGRGRGTFSGQAEEIRKRAMGSVEERRDVVDGNLL